MAKPAKLSDSPTMRRALAESFEDPRIADAEYVRDGGDDGDWEIWQVGQDRYEDQLFGGAA